MEEGRDLERPGTRLREEYWKENVEQEANHMEYAAIRHFADKRYCYATAKGHFVIRLEAKKGDVAKVVLHI